MREYKEKRTLISLTMYTEERDEIEHIIKTDPIFEGRTTSGSVRLMVLKFIQQWHKKREE